MSVYAPDRRQQRLGELIAARDKLNRHIRSMTRDEDQPLALPPVPTKPLVAELADWQTQARLNQAELTRLIQETGGGFVHIQHPRPLEMIL